MAYSGQSHSIVSISRTTAVQAISITGSTLLLDFNQARTGVVLQNNGSILYLKLGTFASLIDYSVRLQPDAILSLTDYTGPISGIRNGTTDTAIITEVF